MEVEKIKEEEIKADDGWTKQEGSGMWLPKEPGDELIGNIESIMDGIYGKQYNILREGETEPVVTPGHKVLQNRMAKAKVGDFVKIVFVREETPSVKGNNPTKLYVVFIKG